MENDEKRRARKKKRELYWTHMPPHDFVHIIRESHVMCDRCVVLFSFARLSVVVVVTVADSQRSRLTDAFNQNIFEFGFDSLRISFEQVGAVGLDLNEKKRPRI